MNTSNFIVNLDPIGIDVSVDVTAAQQALWDDCYYLIAGYVIMEKLVSSYYTDAKTGLPVKSKSLIWGPLMLVYNILMTVFSFTCFYQTYLAVSMNDRYGNDCGLFFRDETFKFTVKMFYYSKYVEFADTLFLIIKGKKVSYLHWFHHIGAAYSMGCIYHASFEGAWIFVMLNGFIHTIMYFYYACALQKIRLPGKPIITTMQIIQFFAGLYFLWGYKNPTCCKNNPSIMWIWLLNYFYVGAVALFFINFYIQSYILNKKTESKSSKKKL